MIHPATAGRPKGEIRKAITMPPMPAAVPPPVTSVMKLRMPRIEAMIESGQPANATRKPSTAVSSVSTRMIGRTRIFRISLISCSPFLKRLCLSYTYIVPCL